MSTEGPLAGRFVDSPLPGRRRAGARQRRGSAVKIPLACALVAAAVWYVALVPMRDEVEALQTRAAHAQSEIQRVNADAAALPALEREVGKLETRARGTSAP